MKATTWLCPVLILLCATRLVCTAQRGYPLDYADSNMLQNDYLLDKRNKPSLSIVNPLDVLRQRLLLEIARRQMKENTRQVELNRAILKNVGKRVSSAAAAAALGGRYALLQQLQQQQEQQQQQLLQPAAQLEYIPSTSIFDFLQRPDLDALENDKKSLDNDNGTKHQLNGNEIGNETNRKHFGKLGASDASNSNNSHNSNNGVAASHVDDEDNDDDSFNDGYQLSYQYGKHKNYYTTK